MKKLLLSFTFLLLPLLAQTNLEDYTGAPNLLSDHFLPLKNTISLLDHSVNGNNDSSCAFFFYAPTNESKNYTMTLSCGITLTPEEYSKYMTALLAIESQKADDPKTDTEDIANESKQ